MSTENERHSQVNNLGVEIDWEVLDEWSTYHLESLSIESFTFGLYLFFWYSILVISLLSEVPLKDGIIPFALVFLLSGLLLGSLKVTSAVFRGLKYMYKHFRPPYNDSAIKLEIPSSDGSCDVIRFDTVTNKSVWIGTFYLTLVVIWLIVVFLIVSSVGNPITEIDQILNAVPLWISEPVVNSITNYTGVSVDSIIQHTSNPALLVFFLLFYGPFFALGGFSAWNYLYALREVVQDFYQTYLMP